MVDKNDYMECPFCAEQIKAKALKCKHCKSFLDTGPAVEAPVRKFAPCPQCGKAISIGATKCKFCKSTIITAEQHKDEGFQETVSAVKPEEKKKTFPALDCKGFKNIKKGFVSFAAGLSLRVDKTFIKENRRMIAFSVGGLFLLVLIVSISAQFGGQLDDQNSEDQLAADTFSDNDIDRVDELDEMMVESPIEIEFAKRVRTHAGTRPFYPDQEVIVVIRFRGVEDAEVENSHLRFNGETKSFFFGHRLSRGGEITNTFAAIVPKEILEFALYVGDYPPVKVHPDEEIKEEL